MAVTFKVVCPVRSCGETRRARPAPRPAAQGGLTMLTRPHSPTIWGLYAGAATFAGMLVVTAAWNLIDRRADVRRLLKL